MDSISNVEQILYKVSLIQFMETEVEEASLSLDKQKGLGPDGIQPSIVKKMALLVKPPPP
jgi:hypothetical protein